MPAARQTPRRSTRSTDVKSYDEGEEEPKENTTKSRTKSSRKHVDETPSKVLGKSLDNLTLDSADKVGTSSGKVVRGKGRPSRARRSLLAVEEEEDDDASSRGSSRENAEATRRTATPMEVDDLSLSDSEEEGGEADEETRRFMDALEGITATFFKGGQPKSRAKPRRRRKRTQGKADPLALDTSVVDEGEEESDDDAEEDVVQQSVNVALQDVKQSLETADHELTEPYNKLFDRFVARRMPQMMSTLCAGYNCILYGVGSKHALMDEFCERHLKRHGIAFLRVDCHLRSTSMKQILQQLIVVLQLDMPTTNCSLMQLTHSFVSHARKLNKFPNVALVLDGLDALPLRDNNAHECVAELCTVDGIRMVATIDHINASLLWSQDKLRRMNARWFEATTYRSYTGELMAGESKFLGLSAKSRGAQHSMSSLDSLWASLTANARRTLVIMARNALEGETNNEMTFWQLFRECRNDFVASSEIQLRQLLVEFTDHHLIRQRRHDTQGDVIVLCVPPPLLKSFLVDKGELDE